MIDKKEVDMAASAHTMKKSSVRSLRFTQHGNFQKILNERVNTYLKENHIPARDVPAMYRKTAIALAWWLGSYLLLLFGNFPPLVNIILCLVWALSIASIGFNVMHDANHGAYSNNPAVNKIVSLSAELLGISGFRWRTKHNIWHHTYTNIAGFDDDVETFGLMRLTPRAPWKPWFLAQVWYFPLVYSLIAFDFFLRDFMMVVTGKSDENHVYPKMNALEQLTFWGGKLFYIVIMFVLPMLVYPWWQVLIGYALVMLTVGLVMGVVFQMAHINNDALFPEPVGNPKHIENEWAVHQVETTADFAPRNRFLNFYTGGLNYQIEHHLLPHICHLNYPQLAPIVKATCEEFGIRYTCYDTWREAFACHLSELRLLGRNT
jgi:linoleoyl-CoA desaturase